MNDDQRHPFDAERFLDGFTEETARIVHAEDDPVLGAHNSSRRRENGLKSAYAAGASGQMNLTRDERDAGFPQRPGVFVSEAGQGLPTPAPPGARGRHPPLWHPERAGLSGR